MTNLFQPLDLTVNRNAKAFMKRKFTEWYSLQVTNQLGNGKNCEEIEVKLLLSTPKPPYASCVLELRNCLTSTSGKEITANGSKAAGISDTIKKLLPLSSPSTLFPVSTLWTNQLKITSTTKQHILMQNLYKPIMNRRLF